MMITTRARLLATVCLFAVAPPAFAQDSAANDPSNT